jgi:hypothetical protein
MNHSDQIRSKIVEGVANMDEFPFELLSQEHHRILEAANQNKVTMRLLGALAFELRCPEQAGLRKALGRTLSDLDYTALSKQWEQVINVLTGLGYEFDERRAMLHGLDRVIFFHPEGLRVDVFFDRLDMCHTVDFRERISLDPETITLADLFLEKMQIVRITQKDIIDTIVLFIAYPVTDTEEGINAAYIAKRMSSDWGFYYTSTTNLKRVRDEFLDQFDLIPEADRRLARGRMDEMLNRIETAPKSLPWKLRAQVGTRTKWYKDVGELERKPEDGQD